MMNKKVKSGDIVRIKGRSARVIRVQDWKKFGPAAYVFFLGAPPWPLGRGQKNPNWVKLTDVDHVDEGSSLSIRERFLRRVIREELRSLVGVRVLEEAKKIAGTLSERGHDLVTIGWKLEEAGFAARVIDDVLGSMKR